MPFVRARISVGVADEDGATYSATTILLVSR